MDNSQLSNHWKQFFNYKYLGAYSFETLDTKEARLTIKNITYEQVISEGGRKENCLIAHFEEKVKPMVLNKTNCKTLTTLFKTGKPLEWEGKSILVYVKSGVKFGGELTDALRIRDYLPKATIYTTDAETKLKNCKSLDELKLVFMSLNKEEQTACTQLKDELKKQLSA